MKKNFDNIILVVLFAVAIFLHSQKYGLENALQFSHLLLAVLFSALTVVMLPLIFQKRRKKIVLTKNRSLLLRGGIAILLLILGIITWTKKERILYIEFTGIFCLVLIGYRIIAGVFSR